jgi:hypothetical protein
MYDQSKVDELLSAIRSGAKSDCVEKVSEHFAVYFDELGITISVKADTPDEEIRDLKNRITTVLSRFESPFRWMVLFQRNGKSAGVLFPDGLFTGAESTRVALVLEPENRELDSMATTMPVWAVESPSNRSVAERFWNKFPSANQRDVGFTLFRTADINAPYDNFVGVLDTLGEHHWGLRQLYVFGLELTEQAQADLQVLGFDAYTPTTHGFVAMKGK